MKRLLFLAAAFALLIAGIESLHVIVAWWEAGRPAPGATLWFAFGVFAAVAWIWWRHSVFHCARGQCLLPDDAVDRPDVRKSPPRG